MTIINQSNVVFESVLPDGQTIDGEEDSNIVKTDIITYLFTKVKSTEKPAVFEGETTTQSVVLTNNSNYLLTDITFSDAMNDGASYQAGSVTIDGISYPAFDLVAGFPIADLNAGESTTITYKIIANNPRTTTPILNHGTVDYNVVDPIKGKVNFVEDTNEITIPILTNRLTNVKSVDKAVSSKGDNLHYTSVITNTGDSTHTNITFKDVLTSGISFVAGSVKVDGVSMPLVSPITGFPLSDLSTGQSHIVEFDVTVL